MRNYLSELIIFLTFSLTPIFFFLFMINSWPLEKKNQQFIENKISATFIELEKDTPIIKTIKNKNQLPYLAFSKQINNGDYIFIYHSKSIAIFVNPKSQEILGLTVVK